MAEPQAGPHAPVTTTPARVPGSVRRTSSIDTARPDGFEADARMDGRARDIVTRRDGSVEVTGEATLWARVGGLTRVVAEVRSDPDLPALGELVGAMVGPGFRGRVDSLVGAEERGTPLYLLLDDFPGAALVSGYALLNAGTVGTRHDKYLDAQIDQCAGWADDAGMMTFIRVEKRAPTPRGPTAPVIERPDDPLSWHVMAPMTPHGMRRRRRIDVIGPDAGGDYRVDVAFRDSHAGADGAETVVHEYGVTASIDAASATVRAIEARADVLPWAECPAAVGSAARLVGHPLADLRSWVRKNLTGTPTCTHLNDTLRGLADVEVLIRQLVAAED